VENFRVAKRRRARPSDGATEHAVSDASPAPTDAVLALQRAAGNRAVAGLMPAKLAVQRAVIPHAGIDGLDEDLDTANLPKGKALIDEMARLHKLVGMSDLEAALNAALPTETHAQNNEKLVKYLRGYQTSGLQDVVQKKMDDLIRMFRDQQLQGAVDPEANTTAEFRDQLDIDGLCGGWTVMFMEHPDWVEPMYNAVRTWVRPSQMTDANALQHFETHLRRVTRFDGVENVVQLVREVYSAMDVLEPTKYRSLPNWTDQSGVVTDMGDSPTTDESADVEESVIKLRGKNAAQAVCARLDELTREAKELECMAHIESDLHHMAIRVQKRHPEGKTTKLNLVITVVESELQGMKKVESWDKAQPILDTWLSTKEPDLKEIIVRTRLVDLSGD
jgi:hypothetical protein